MAESTHVRVVLEERVAVLTIDRPKVNALNRATLTELFDGFRSVAEDRRVRSIVITGAGAAFVAGADIREIAEIMYDRDALRAFSREGQEILDTIEASPKPVIAAVNGAALGGGLELALACHLRVLADSARVGQTEVNLGLIPGWGGTQRLARTVGPSKALEMTLTGDVIGAEEALRLGLANKVVPEAALLSETLVLAQRIAGKGRLATAAALRAVLRSASSPLVEGLLGEAQEFAGLSGTPDLAEGLAAFVERRPARFVDD